MMFEIKWKDKGEFRKYCALGWYFVTIILIFLTGNFVVRMDANMTDYNLAVASISRDFMWIVGSYIFATLVIGLWAVSNSIRNIEDKLCRRR